MKRILHFILLCALCACVRAQVLELDLTTNSGAFPLSAQFTSPAHSIYPRLYLAQSWSRRLAPGTNYISISPGPWTVQIGPHAGNAWSFYMPTNNATNNLLDIASNPPPAYSRSAYFVAASNGTSSNLTDAGWLTIAGNQTNEGNVTIEGTLTYTGVLPANFNGTIIDGSGDINLQNNASIGGTGWGINLVGYGTISGLTINSGGWLINNSPFTNAAVAVFRNHVIISNGVASYATNQYTFSSGGYTNAGTNTIRVWGFTGTNFMFSNSVSKVHFSLGTVTNAFFTLNPNESLQGTNCTVAGAVDF